MAAAEPIQMQPIGVSGVNNIYGSIYDEESNASLSGGAWYNIFNKMYNEEVNVKAGFHVATLPVLLATWGFKWPEGYSGDQRVLEYSKEFWRRSETPLHEWLQQAVFYKGYGNFPFEKVYKIEDGVVWIKELSPRKPHHQSRYEVDEHGKLKTYVQYALNSGYHYIPAEKLLILTNDNAFGANYEGKSDLRQAYRSYTNKEILVLANRNRLKRYAAPFPVFNEPPDEPNKDADVRASNRSRINETAKRFLTGGNPYVILPNGWSMELIQHDTGNDTTIDAIRYHDSQIFLSTLAGVAGMGSTTTATQGLGDTMSSLASMGPRSTAKYIGEKFTKDVLRPLIDMNFGKQSVYPEFFASDVGGAGASAAPFITSAVQGGGLSKDLSVENYLRRMFGIDGITKEEFEKMSSAKEIPKTGIRAAIAARRSITSKAAEPPKEEEQA